MNPRHSRWQRDALPLSYTRIADQQGSAAANPNFVPQRAGGGKSSEQHGPWRLTAFLLALVTGAVALFAHWPVLSAQALTMDDAAFLTHNPLVLSPSWHSAGRFLAEVLEPSTVRGYYLPLSMLSLMLDVALGGRPDDLRVFHRTSLLLHVANTVLLALLLARLFGRADAAAVAALLFGVHPLAVEPVAWVGERKTVLATFFSLLSLLTYVHAARAGASGWRMASLFAFGLALLAKPTSLALPLVLAALDRWPLERFSRRSLCQLGPFFALALAGGAVAVVSHARTAGFTGGGVASFATTAVMAGYRLVFYLRKFVWPIGLTPLYPAPQPFALGHPEILLSLAATASAAILLWRTGLRALKYGALVYLMLLAPTLGSSRYSWVLVSDKYFYLPVLGILLIVAWGLSTLWRADGKGVSAPVVRTVTTAAAAVVVGLLTIATRGQLAHWQTTEGLCRHMEALAPGTPGVHNDLGNELARQERYGEALAAFERAIQLNPDWYKPHANLGLALLALGQTQAAVTALERAVQLNPRHGSAYNGLGSAYQTLGRTADAIAAFQKAIERDPLVAAPYHNLADLLRALGRHDEAAQVESRAPRYSRDAPI